MSVPSYISSIATADPIRLDARDPLDLSSARTAYWIQNGSVDLFLVNRQNGEQGFRDYCTSFEAGSLIMPLPGINDVQPIVVGNQHTQVIPLSLGGIKKSDELEAISSKIDTWLEAFIAGIHTNLPIPTHHEVIENAGPHTIEKDSRVSPVGQPLWLDIENKDLIYCDNFEIDPSKHALFPVTSDTWITIPEKDTYTFQPTIEILRQPDSLNHLQSVHAFLLDVYHTTFWEERHKEKKLLKKSIRERRKDRATAFAGLSNVIERAEQNKESFSETSREAPLIQALNLIVNHGDQRFEHPKDAPTNSFSAYLKAILQHNDLRSRQISLSDQWWTKQSGSMLGFAGPDQQPVALIPSEKSYEIHNPATNSVTRVGANNAPKIHSVAYGVYESFPNRPLSVKDLLQFSLTNHSGDLWTIGTMGLLASVLGLLTPILTGYVFDYAIPDSSYSELMEVSTALVLAAFASVAFQATRNIAMLRLEGKTDLKLQAGVWDRILKLPSRFFRQFNAGELAKRANSINSIRQLMAGATITTMLSAIFNLLNVVLLFWYAPTLGWFACGLLVLALIFLTSLVLYRMNYQRERQFIAQSLSGTVQQLLNGIAKIKTTGSEGSAMLVWAKKFGRKVNYTFRIQRTQNWSTILMGIYPILSSGAIFYLVGSNPHHLQLSTGTYLAFSAAFTTLLTTITTLSQTAQKVTQAVTLYEKSKPILEATPEVDETKKNPGTLKGHIELKNVDFKYNRNTPLVLRDVSFTAYPGEFVAIVGPSGSGKSTLFRLLLGFENPDSGNIFYDHKNLEGLDINQVRRQFGVVLQESQLMAGSLYRNIIGSKTELTIDDAWEAAEKVGIAKDINDMPMGMHTMISENGTNISGGQKQRLMIARAIIQRPNIMLMDEATSALDNHTQKLVKESLDRIKATRIVIAHRLSTIKNADNIIVLKKGIIQEQGTYQELMNREDLFAELANRQLA